MNIIRVILFFLIHITTASAAPLDRLFFDSLEEPSVIVTTITNPTTQIMVTDQATLNTIFEFKIQNVTGSEVRVEHFTLRMIRQNSLVPNPFLGPLVDELSLDGQFELGVVPFFAQNTTCTLVDFLPCFQIELIDGFEIPANSTRRLRVRSGAFRPTGSFNYPQSLWFRFLDNQEIVVYSGGTRVAVGGTPQLGTRLMIL